MFNDDGQTQLENNWKQNTNEHPTDRILTANFNTNNPIRNSQSNKYKSETKYIIQRQRVIRSFLNKSDEFELSIQKPPRLCTQSKALSVKSIPSPHLLFDELNEQSTNNNNRQQTINKELGRQSPILIRHHRSTIENLSSTQQVSDITNISKNQLSLTIPSNFTYRNKPSRTLLSDRSSSFKIDDPISSSRIKPLNYSKTINENILKQNTFNSKLFHPNNSLPTYTWTSKLPEQGVSHTRTLTNTCCSKSHLSKQFINRQQHQLQSERKTNYTQDFYISPRSLNNLHHELEMNKKIQKIRLIVDNWENVKSINDGISDDEVSISTDGNSSISTCNSQVSIQQYDHTSSSSILSNQHDIFSSSNLFIDNSKSKIQRSPTKKSISRRRSYNLALSPVAEHVNDEETDMKKILEKICTLQNNDINDEDSLTFQLLNQQETKFEKKLSKLRKFQFKQK